MASLMTSSRLKKDWLHSIWIEIQTSICENGFNTRFTVDNGDFYNTADIKGDGSDIFALEDDFDELESQYSDLIIDNPTLEYFESASANYRNEFISILDENDIDDSTQVNNLVADVMTSYLDFGLKSKAE